MKRFFGSIFILLISFQAIQAEPTKSIQYLMNEPVSMFDFGISKLKHDLNNQNNKMKIGGLVPSIYIYYNWDTNRIKISINYVVPKDYKKEIPKDYKKQMEKLIFGLKMFQFQISPETGRPIIGDTSSLGLFFTPTGYNNLTEPNNIRLELDKITEIEVSFLSGKGDLSQCKAPLIGTDIYWKKK